MSLPNKVCAICGKGYKRAIARSHSMQATIRRLKPNLQWLRLSSGKRVHACAKCIKSQSQGKVRIPQTVLAR